MLTLSRLPVLVGTVLALVLGLGAAPAAEASSTVLCTGTAKCRSLGMGDGGFARVRNQMHWRMYAGHNCTNYAAWRMIADGAPTERPWSGSGMAGEWGKLNRKILTRTPTVGSVAWWESGHVAYVERVESDDQIVVSEDSWSQKKFSWRRITVGRSWPTGFLHFIPSTRPKTVPKSVPARTKIARWVVPKKPRRVIRVRVKVAPVDPAAGPVEGRVRVRVAKQAKVVDLSDGIAVLRFHRVKRGKRSYAVVYQGSPTMARAKVTGTVWAP